MVPGQEADDVQDTRAQERGVGPGERSRPRQSLLRRVTAELSQFAGRLIFAAPLTMFSRVAITPFLSLPRA